MMIVAMAWLFVTLTMALTLSNGLAGIAFAVVVGVLPVLLYMLLVLRRHRARRERQSSMLEQQVDPADDADAKPDQ